MRTRRSLVLLGALAPVALGIVVSCSSSEPSGGGGGGGNTDMARAAGQDMAGASSMADMSRATGGCPDLETYCADASHWCVRSWASAMNAASWCSASKGDVDIFVPKAPCTDGYRMIILGGANFYDNKHFIYADADEGALLGVVSVTGEGAVAYTCEAGDPMFANLMFNGCSYDQPAMCVGGQLQ